MPKYYSVIAEIIVLQKTIQGELEELDFKSQDILNQFFIYTATWSLPIWERIFGLSVGDETSNIEERRENLISKLRSYGTTTKDMIIRVGNAFTNGGVQIIEHNENYSFEVVFTNVIGIPKNMEDFKKKLRTRIAVFSILNCLLLLAGIVFRSLVPAGENALNVNFVSGILAGLAGYGSFLR